MTDEKPVPFLSKMNSTSGTASYSGNFAVGGLVSPPKATEPSEGTTTPDSAETASNPPAKRRGRPPKPKTKTEAEIRAELTAEITAQVLAELTSKQTSEATLKTEDIPEVDPDAEDSVTINFVDDGLTLLGTTWCRGEELTVKRGSEEWKQTLDGKGRSILEYSEAEQLVRWQRRIYSQGHWLGKGYDLNDPTLTPEDRAALLAAEERRKIRVAVPGSRKARGRLNS